MMVKRWGRNREKGRGGKREINTQKIIQGKKGKKPSLNLNTYIKERKKTQKI